MGEGGANSVFLGVEGILAGGVGKEESETTVSKLIAEAAIPELTEGLFRCLLARPPCLLGSNMSSQS